MTSYRRNALAPRRPRFAAGVVWCGIVAALLGCEPVENGATPPGTTDNPSPAPAEPESPPPRRPYRPERLGLDAPMRLPPVPFPCQTPAGDLSAPEYTGLITLVATSSTESHSLPVDDTSSMPEMAADHDMPPSSTWPRLQPAETTADEEMIGQQDVEIPEAELVPETSSAAPGIDESPSPELDRSEEEAQPGVPPADGVEPGIDSVVDDTEVFRRHPTCRWWTSCRRRTRWRPCQPQPTAESLAPAVTASAASVSVQRNEAERIARHGYSLANRGMLFSARREFLRTLRVLAHAKDASAHGRTHSDNLTKGLRTIEEADDFRPRGTGVEAEIDMALIVSSHHGAHPGWHRPAPNVASRCDRSLLRPCGRMARCGGGGRTGRFHGSLRVGADRRSARSSEE